METSTEKALREVNEMVQQLVNAQHRALDDKYNLIRVSTRRWRVVRIERVLQAKDTTDDRDVIIFEMVSKPLGRSAAFAEMRRFRESKVDRRYP